MNRPLVLLLLAACGAHGTEPWVVNHDVPMLASLPSFDAHPGGRLTFAWGVYERDVETMWATSLAGGQMASAVELAPAGVHCQPRFVATGANDGWAFWTRRREGRWEVAARRLAGGSWLPPEVLSDPTHDAMAPAAVADGSRVTVAFERHSVPQAVVARTWDGRRWSSAATLSGGGAPAYRPALASGPAGEVWAFWDSYLPAERAYAVFGRPVLPAPGPAGRISAPGRNSLKPAAVWAARAGLAVAWLDTEEVTGGAGVLDHWDTIRVATRGAGGWRSTTAEGGEPAVVPLAFGLLARMEPEFEAVWGYAGRRRHPILLDGDGSLWLLWERRIRSGGQSGEPGRLCARRFEGNRWSAPAVLHEGLVEYAVPENSRAAGGKVAVLGRDIRHRFLTLSVDLASGKPLAFEPWPGWRPVQLPRSAPPPRPAIRVDGRRHQLYWGDLHVHSILTPDAEGEVDELMHFTRDKASLDVVVIQENDSNSWSPKAFADHRLSASEYTLSVYFSRRHTEPGRFLALPGFEWSQRTADDNQPNHRTVMYAGPDTPIIRHSENGGDFDELCRVAGAAGGNMFTQHEAFRLTGCAADTNIEVATGWGVYIRNPEKIHRELSAGHRVGFVATSDGHRRNPGTGGGLTGIWAAELTPQAVLDALKRRRVFATSGTRVVVDARANERFMGEDVEAGDTVALRVRVTSPKPVARLVLVRDGREIRVEPGGGGTSFNLAHTDRPGPGFHWYYWRVELEGTQPQYRGNVKPAEGLYAWSSPHRVTCAR